MKNIFYESYAMNNFLIECFAFLFLGYRPKNAIELCCVATLQQLKHSSTPVSSSKFSILFKQLLNSKKPCNDNNSFVNQIILSWLYQ